VPVQSAKHLRTVIAAFVWATAPIPCRPDDGRELIVHRKGATPAAAGALGVIPGTMVQDLVTIVARFDPKIVKMGQDGSRAEGGRLMSFLI